MIPARICLRLALLGGLAASLLGCGDSAPPPEAAQQGAEAQRIVGAFAEKAKRYPAAAPNDLAILMETLDMYATTTEGEQAATYVKLRDTAKQLQELYAGKAPKTEINAKLEEMVQVAQSLPGQPTADGA